MGVTYGTDVEKLRHLLRAVAAGNPDVLAEPGPDLLFVGYGDSAINSELAVWSTAMLDSPRRFKSSLHYAIHKKLEEHRIEILSVYLIIKNGLYRQSVLAVGFVALWVHLLARPVPGVGIAVPIFVPPLITAIVAVAIASD